MKLSRKSDYALRALCTLAENESGGPLSIRELAEGNDIPKRFLEQILLDLKRIGVVDSIPGRDGGYVLGRSASEITMGQIVRHFDGMLAPLACVSQRGYEACSQEGKCRFRRVLLTIRNYTARMMDGVTLAALLSVEPVRPLEITNDLVDGAGI